MFPENVVFVLFFNLVTIHRHLFFSPPVKGGVRKVESEFDIEVSL